MCSGSAPYMYISNTLQFRVLVMSIRVYSRRSVVRCSGSAPYMYTRDNLFEYSPNANYLA